MNEHDILLIEIVTIAEEIKHGLSNPKKAARLAELILKMHNHLFNGGSLPQAWFVPMLTPITKKETKKKRDSVDKDAPDFESKKTQRRLPKVAV